MPEAPGKHKKNRDEFSLSFEFIPVLFCVMPKQRPLPLSLFHKAGGKTLSQGGGQLLPQRLDLVLLQRPLRQQVYVLGRGVDEKHGGQLEAAVQAVEIEGLPDLFSGISMRMR